MYLILFARLLLILVQHMLNLIVFSNVYVIIKFDSLNIFEVINLFYLQLFPSVFMKIGIKYALK